MRNFNLQTRTHKNVPVTYIDGDSNKPAIFYHHGLYGTRDGDHAKAIQTIAEQNNLTFIAFDNLGHGDNQFPLEKANLENWITTTQDILRQTMATNQELILVGNSCGAHTMFKAFQEIPFKIKGFVGISAAPNVINDVFEPYLKQQLDTLPQPSLKEKFNAGATINVPVPGAGIKPVSTEFFEIAKQHKITPDDIMSCEQVHLIKGCKDPIVSNKATINFLSNFSKAAEKKVYITQDDHSLSKPKSQAMIKKAILDLSIA